MTDRIGLSFVSERRKEKESKRLLDEKKELENQFNTYRRRAGEKLSKVKGDYDMLERRHQKQLFDEQNKVRARPLRALIAP
jgi:hypothetical protein